LIAPPRRQLGRKPVQDLLLAIAHSRDNRSLTGVEYGKPHLDRLPMKLREMVVRIQR
jgi:hypothetical protein